MQAKVLCPVCMQEPVVTRVDGFFSRIECTTEGCTNNVQFHFFNDSETYAVAHWDALCSKIKE